MASHCSAHADVPVLDEVTIFANRHLEKLADTPVAITSIYGKTLVDQGVSTAQDLRGYVPSFGMTETALGTILSIRGIRSDANPSFEQAVALYSDGIQLGRAQLARAPFLDIETIDVLRGPQSVLLGKHATAGAFVIRSAQPSDKQEASLQLVYEPEYGNQEVQAMVSGPISETLSGRMAILNRQTEGFFENTTLNRTESAEQDRLMRATFVWKPIDTWAFRLKLEDGHFNSLGRDIEVISPVSLNPNDSNPYRTALSYLSAGSYHLESTQDAMRQSNGDFNNNDMQSISFKVERDLGDIAFEAITGYHAYQSESLCDCDFIGAPIININSTEKYRQFSQSLQWSSQEQQALSWVAGLQYQTNRLDVLYRASAPDDSYLVAKAISPLLVGAASQREFGQDVDLYAGYFQAKWNMNAATHLILGGRYTQESKTAKRHQYHIAPNGFVLPEGTVNDPYNQLWALFKVEPHSVSGSRSERNFSPQIMLQYDLNASDMVYASYTSGVKSGGFDASSNSVPHTQGGIFNDIEGSWEFAAETIKSRELGGKFMLANKSLAINLALFRSDLSNMQISEDDKGIGYNVNNLGAAIAQGIELDSRWFVSSKLAVRSGVALLDFEYTHMPNGSCYFGQVDNSVPYGDALCDASGKTHEFAPKTQTNIGIDSHLVFASRFKLSGTLEAIYSSKYLTLSNLDPRMQQAAYTKINARIALTTVGGAWEVALLGKNLTDKRVMSFAGELPLARTLTQGYGSGYYGFYEPPRSIALQAKIQF
ncbi:MAG TPA: TonB-dependent receptor [Cellvibrio sp.]|nr:TonB-dependent receptor [Cellvibrio sp.]